MIFTTLVKKCKHKLRTNCINFNCVIMGKKIVNLGLLHYKSIDVLFLFNPLLILAFLKSYLPPKMEVFHIQDKTLFNFKIGNESEFLLNLSSNFTE